MNNPRKYPNVAVIGAGPAGLTAIKCLLEEGLTPVAFERNKELGGNWRYDEALPDGGGLAYRSLKTNTSRQMTKFSDFPFPAHLPDFLPRAEVLKYLNDYAHHFQLRTHIRFQTTVESATPIGEGQWRVTVRTPVADQETHVFDALVVASGYFQEPFSASYPGSETFQGQVLHSADYKGPEGYEGKRVIIIGAGSSGADIASEVSTVAASVEMSCRSGVWFVPHQVGGKPYDCQQNRLMTRIPAQLSQSLFHKYLLKIYQDNGFTKDKLGLLNLSAFDPQRSRFVASHNILEKILNGAVHMKPDIATIMPNGVTYTDQTQTPADVLIYCTGYSLRLPFLDPQIIPIEEKNIVRLYKQVFHPTMNNLAFLAMNFVAGSSFPVAEIQARWVALVYGGKLQLPSPEARTRTINEFFAERNHLGIDPAGLLATEYLEEIAGLIGVRPQLLKHLSLIPKLLLGPLLSAHYRLDGPGKSAQVEAFLAKT